ncbi:K02A2.6-like [Cordylochernes scorpioides]|uniref:K02A2.6-like n=1 Tax=Cordylochernes scorpioides TaxID=51811 RepID=A0ABY6LMH6_9ARAC|nr:K02A2.6-like [Cordylochernes scorpioides]
MSRRRVFEWYKRFKEGREESADNERSGRPSTSTTPGYKNKVLKLVREDRRITVREFAEEAGISFGSTQSIMKDNLGVRRLNVFLVPKDLTFDQKNARKKTAGQSRSDNRRPRIAEEEKGSDLYGLSAAIKWRPQPSFKQSLVSLCFSPSPPDAPIETLLSGISVCPFHRWPSCVAFHPDCTVELTSRLPRPKSRQDCGRQGTSKQVDHCLYRKMEQGREGDSKKPMESDPDYERGENATFPKMENTFGRTQEIAPSQEDATPPPVVSDFLGSLNRTLHQLFAATGLSRDVELPRYNVSYEAKSFFTNYDAQADRAQLQYSKRLRKPPNLLQAPLRVTNTPADRFIIGMIDQEVKKKLLEDPQLTLPKAISVATIAESVCVQIASWEEKQAMIEKINKNTWEKNRSRVEKAKAGPSIASTRNECKWCGQQHRYVCRTRRIRNLIAENEGDESFEGGINVNKVLVKTVRSDKWSAVISINGNKTSVHLDTGAQINVLPQKVISLWPAKPIIKPTSLKAYAYGHSELPIVGKCEVLCQYGEKKSLYEFIIADVDAQTLITGDTCEKLEILKRINQINSHQMILHDQTKKILEQFHEVFQGVGVINSECKMYTKPEYPPVRALPRRIPASLGNEVQSELEKMVKQGIITKIYHETEWSHPMVVVKKKSGQIRICLDPRKLNQALVRRHFQTPAPSELLHQIPKADYYTVLDVKSAYWHVPVANECRDLLVMATPFGKFRYNRLPFGLNISAQIFVEMMTNIFKNSFRNVTYVDDLLIYADSIEEHNEKLKGILEIARRNNIKFDLTKAQICKKEVSFLGHMISKNGIDPEPNKVDKVINLKKPEDKKSLQRVMGLYNYLGKFIPNLAASTSNIRGILKKNVVWHWGPRQDIEFHHIKECVRNAPSLGHYDKTKTSNGLAERNIQTIKTLLNKCKDQGSDAYLALLTYRNTPKNDLPSPAQLCLSRSLRCLIPRIIPLYGPCKTNQRHIENAKKRRQISMKRYYDRSSKIYPKVSVGEEAWCQLSPKQAWTPVKITAHGNSPQSFKVETPSGREFLRNQQFLRPKNGPSGKGESPSLGTSFSGESSPVAADSSSWERTTEEEPVAGPSTTPIQQQQPRDGMAVPSENSSVMPRFSRFGRELKKPQRLGF